MKPRTKIEIKAVEASRRLSGLTPAQTAWGKAHCFDNEAYCSGREAWCSSCGGAFPWQMTDRLADTLNDKPITCPHCGATLKPRKSRRLKLNEKSYYTIVTTCQGLQVQRTFEASRKGRKGECVEYRFYEVVQLWLDAQGNEAVIACNRAPFSYYVDRWCYGTMSCKRSNHYVYGNPYMFMGVAYPRHRVLPVIRRSGYKPMDGVVAHQHMRTLLRRPHAETLQKAGQRDLLRYMINRSWSGKDEWNAVKVAIRNGYIVKDATTWVDYIDNLRELGLDTHNAHYVCPADLQAAHDRMRKRVERKRAKEELERQRQEAAADEAAFAEAKKRFMGLLITDGDLLIRPLRSVAEFADEGEAMHHCVFSNRYYRKENSLILTARAADKTRIETIEVDLQSYRIVQSRGVNNKETAEHEQIVTLVTSNINKIKKLAKNESKKTKSASGCRC